MSPWLVAGAALTVLIVQAHSVVGEIRIFHALRRPGQVVPTDGGTLLRGFQVRILWGCWHGLSVVGLGLAGVQLWLARPAARLASAGQVEMCVAGALAGLGLMVLVSNRGRHPAWVALWLNAALVWMAQ